MRKKQDLLRSTALMLVLSSLGLAGMAQTQIPIPTNRTDSVLTTGAATELPAILPDSARHVKASLVQERLAKLQNRIPLTYNTFSHEYVEYFIYKKTAFTKTMLERVNQYFPIYEKFLAQYGLPDELKYLSLIESGLNTKAISYAGAAGLWQFMPRTATLDFGLRIDKYVDERLDPIKSTEAACKYFVQLYRIFGDWEMVLASYNTGPGNTRRAIRRSGNKTGFWEVYDQLPLQTRAYVPQYVGMLYIINYAADHGIRPDLIENPIPYDTVHINGYANLQTFASLSQIPYETLQKLNPHVLTNQLPANTRDFALRVPSDHYAYIAANRQMIMDSMGRSPRDPFIRYAVARGDSTQERRYANVTVEEEEPEVEMVVRHKSSKQSVKVRRGQTLGSIADQYNVSIASLKQWNHLGKRGTIMAGQKLVIIKDVVVSQPVRVAKAETPSREEKRRAEITNHLKAKAKYHTVQRGDTLWSIVQRYDVTLAQLKRLNRIHGSSVKPGMKLRVS